LEYLSEFSYVSIEQYLDVFLSTLLHTKNISIPSLRSNIRMVERFVFELNDQFHYQDIFLDRIMISVTEAVNNAIIHGNKADPDKRVELSCFCYDDHIEFVVVDQGVGFIKETLPDPLAEKNLLKEGGRGILIIEHMMDSVSFSKTDSGMELRMSISF
jgi:serine/threonine-protein kinase RsbW